MVMGLCLWLIILEINGLEWFYANEKEKEAFLVVIVGVCLVITRKWRKKHR